jgi:hypothetical protein
MCESIGKHSLDWWRCNGATHSCRNPVTSTLNECRFIDDAAAWKLSEHCPIQSEID